MPYRYWTGTEPDSAPTTDQESSSTPSRTVAPKSTGLVRAVALPSEHGGWSLSLEPAILGLLVAPSWSGVILSIVGLLAFVARTPLKVAMVDRWRDRRLARTILAERILFAELVGLALLLWAAFALSDHQNWWWPLVLATPLFAVELWYDMQSRGRRLIPLVAGPIGIGALAASVVYVGGGSTVLGLGAWLAVSIRAVAAILFVRYQVARVHGRATASPLRTGLVQIGAGLVAIAAWVAGFVPGLTRLLPWPVALLVAIIVGIHFTLSRRPAPAAKIVGFQQLALGIVFVIVAGLTL